MRMHLWGRISLRLFFFLMGMTSGFCAFAQQTDSLRIRRDSVPLDRSGHLPILSDSLSPAERADLPAIRSVPLHPSSSRRKDAWMQGPVPPYYLNPSPMFKGDYSTSGVLGRVGGGYFVGAGSQTSVPGIGRFNAAALGWQKQLNEHLQLQLMADAVKSNTAHFTSQSFGLSGQMVWQAQDRLYFRTFGGVGFGDFSGRPAYGFGGTVGFDVTERFGMELGAQSYYNSLTGRWEVLPIVAPYYKFDKFKLQLDVGPILFEVIRGIIEKHCGGGHREGPTIMSDVPGFRH